MSSLRLSEAKQEITRSAAFRLTLRFATIFAACLLVLNLGIGLSARWAVEHMARGQVEEELGRLERAFHEDGATGLVRLIAEDADDAEEDGIAFGYRSAEEALLAGGLDIPEPEVGWTTFAPEGADEDESLWVKTVRLSDGNWLSVATDTETYHDVAELMLAGAVWTVAIALPLALLSGALLSRSVLRRLARITETTAGVREGELWRRAPLAGTQDEFDRLAANINTMLDAIESLTRNLRNVSVGIAHELRTPLARIRNRLVEMKGRGAEPDQSSRGIDGAVDEIDSALTTFDALLKIGQIEANAQRAGFETVRFSDLVAELAEVYEPVAAEQGKRFSARVTAGVELRGDRALLAQMISNLLENAIEHTPTGTTIIVELGEATEGRKLVVEDDGPGIPPTESERIFDRFYRLDRSRMRPGNGLGLSLVRSICGLHGFTVRLNPNASGARFEVLL